LLECFHLVKKNTELNRIQLNIIYSENKYERIIELTSISGKKESCSFLIVSFVKSLMNKVRKIRIVKKLDITNIEDLLKDHKQTQRYSNNYNYEHLNEEESSIVDYSNREASNFYEFYKILSQENYDLGKSVRDFVEDFRNKYSSIDLAKNLIPKPMGDIVSFIEDCVSAFHCYFNFGKSNTEKLLPYCRPAVEKFIFNKLYVLLYEIYYKRYEEENNKYIQNQNAIKTKLSIEEIMDFLEIKKKFREESSDKKFNYLPFKSTIDCLNKIEFEQNPKDKFDTLMKASLELRNGILDVTKGRVKNKLNFRVN